MLSFAIIILIGSVLLSFSFSINKDIRWIDALFTATSAVTVTGLGVLDTSQDFTKTGLYIILVLIQLGGLGILTFSNLFIRLFKSSQSIKNRMFIGNLTNEGKMASVFQTLFKIIFITFMIESLGCIMIYYTVGHKLDDGVFFSIFHSISAFCNAGFSTLQNSLSNTSVKFEYSFSLIICWLIVSGGLGHNIMINHYQILKIFVYNKTVRLFRLKKPIKVTIKDKSIYSALVVRTTFILILFGWIFFMLLEWDGVLVEHTSFLGKSISALFNSITPRTAGFNNINMNSVGLSTVMFIVFLMWIGASPGSTGGGIKTPALAISMLNLFNLIRGKKNMVLLRKQISSRNLLLINSIILLSFIAIGFSVFLISIIDPQFTFQEILFEAVSAYSTVGLSLGITPVLSDGSKVVIMLVMFMGRVSFLTILIGFYRQFYGENKEKFISYPRESIYIN